jgi:hypothetical protein
MGICLVCILLASTLAAITSSATIQSTGSIKYPSSNVWLIGQYSNGTYYSINPAATINTESSYASTLINNAMLSASSRISVNPFFSNSFQSDSFTGWSSTSGSPSIVTSPVYSGCTYAAQFNEGGTAWNWKYCTENVASTSAIDVKEYVNFANLVNGRQFAIEVSGSGGAIAYAGILSNTSWGILDYTTGDTYGSATSTISTGAWYCIELSVFLGSGTGSLTLSVNGAQVASATGLTNTGNGNIASVSVGAFDWGTGFEDYIDNVTIGTPSITTGGTVRITPGSYCLNQALVPQSNVYLNVSSSATLYQNPPSSLNSSISLMLTTLPVQDFTLNGGIWNGNKGTLTDHRTTGTWATNFFDYFGIAFYWGSGNTKITVENALVENVIGQGIEIGQATNSLVYNCTVINAGDNPITIEGQTGFNGNDTANQCTVQGGQDVGINTFDLNNCTIENCHVSNVTQYSGASHWGIAAEAGQYINILNNHVSACEDDIDSYSNYTLIANNVVNGQNNIGESAGIHVLGCNYDTVLNNTISSCGYPLATYSNTQTFNCKFINNTVINSSSVIIAGTNVTVSGGSIQVPTDPNGDICLESAQNVQILNVSFYGADGLTDYSECSNNIYFAYCNFTGVSGTKVSLSLCTNVTYADNIGYP